MKLTLVLRRFCLTTLAFALCSPVWAQTDKKDGANEIRVAVFPLDAAEGFAVDSKALTDQVTTILAGIGNLRLIERAEMSKASDEHKIALSGLADGGSAVKLGKFVNAQFVVVGKGTRIGQTNHVSLKIINVETTGLTVVAAKATVEGGADQLIDRLETSLTEGVAKLKKTADAGDAALAELKKLVKPLAGKVFLLDVSEQHVNRPLADPAAQVAIANRLRALDLMVIIPKDPVAGWKQHLLETGKYGEKKVDYLLEGEGLSGLAGQVQGLTSCRARVELRIIGVPGRSVDVTDKGVAAGVDLVEALAAKSALEEAGKQAADLTLKRLVAE
ncbi:MAG: hypothetical protein JSS02_04670 [Planctomycetes bacterium]|nr:hypothetical protein [Planctomycetota bacterium]